MSVTINGEGKYAELDLKQNNSSGESSDDDGDETVLVKSSTNTRLTGIMAVKHAGSNLSLAGLKAVQHAGSNLSLTGLKSVKHAGSNLSLTGRKIVQRAGSNLSLTGGRTAKNGSNIDGKLERIRTQERYHAMKEDYSNKNGTTAMDEEHNKDYTNKHGTTAMDEIHNGTTVMDEENNKDMHSLDITSNDSHLQLDNENLEGSVVLQSENNTKGETIKKEKKKKEGPSERKSLSQIETCFSKLRTSITFKLKKRKHRLEEEIGILDEEPKKKRRKNRANAFFERIFARIHFRTDRR